MLVKYIRDRNKLIGCVVGLEPGKIGVSICHDKATHEYGSNKCQILAQYGKYACIVFPNTNYVMTVNRKDVKTIRDTFTKKEAKARAIERAQNGTGPTIPHREIQPAKGIGPCLLSDEIVYEVAKMEQRLQPKPPKAQVESTLMGFLNRFM